MNASDPVLIGFTGHQTLTPETRKLIHAGIREDLEKQLSHIGLTSLAAGADQIFAETVLDLGGRLIAVIPSQNYAKSFHAQEDLKRFRKLINLAEQVVTMPFEEPAEEAYWAAGKEIVRRSDRLLAVWDGRPSGGLGGTADVVRYARSHGKQVAVIWPYGARRR